MGIEPAVFFLVCVIAAHAKLTWIAISAIRYSSRADKFLEQQGLLGAADHLNHSPDQAKRCPYCDHHVD